MEQPPSLRRLPEPHVIRSDRWRASFSLVRDVRLRLMSHPTAGDEFLGLLQDFGTGKITDARAVVACVRALLQGHPDLVARFNQMFPR